MPITFEGDVSLPYPVLFRRPDPSPYVFNLEGPVTKASRPEFDKIALRTDPEDFDATFGADPPIAVSLANNHIFDYGKVGFEDTVAFLERRGIRHFGAGIQGECGNPLLMPIDGCVLGLLGYVCASTSPVIEVDGYGCALFDPERVEKDIARTKSLGAEATVVQIHWGAEHVYMPKPDDLRLARGLIAAGVVVIIGHHAHRIQFCERRGASRIFYGLGNLAMPESCRPECNATGVGWMGSSVWNRTSLAVIYDPRTRKFATRKMLFDAAHIAPIEGSFGEHSTTLSDFLYPARYRLSYLCGKLRFAINHAKNQRQLLRTRHVRSLMTLLRESVAGKACK